MNIISNKTNLSFLRIDNNILDWEQMILISECKYNVMANSTFSWWGSYMNIWSQNIICCPKKWYINSSSANDLYMPNFVLI